MTHGNLSVLFAKAIGIVVIAGAVAACGVSAVGSLSSQRDPLEGLGEKLFTDTALSLDGSVSCMSCHIPDALFTDGKTVAEGVNGQPGTRNAPGLADVTLMTSFFWDGREPRLENAVVLPFTNPVEMALPDNAAVVQHVRSDASYGAFFKNAFGDAEVDFQRIQAALTAYVRAIPVTSTRYDSYVASGRRQGLEADEIAGLAIFEGKGECAECHLLTGNPAPFTDNLYHHTGIGFEKVSGNVQEMLARMNAAEDEGRSLGALILSDRDIAELGRFVVTQDPSELGAFRTPTLRNVALTAPYMHDGSVLTLGEAVEYEIYYRGLSRGRPISITAEERRQLTAFLRALNSQ
ncbi:MAG: methylamine utilization protein [Xanthomonadaceae bacterium]|jgi:cytochrome c peroxidase|nr:methylamine utilization protein [Xanthomonadaceae bacterium]